MGKLLGEKELNLLKQKTPYSLPDNPSDKGLSASQIKVKFYEGYFLLYNWVKDLYTDNNELHKSIDEIPNKLDKINENNIVYATNEIGNQKTINYTSKAQADSIVKRDENSTFKISSPISDNNPATKKYVDEQITSNDDVISFYSFTNPAPIIDINRYASESEAVSFEEIRVYLNSIFTDVYINSPADFNHAEYYGIGLYYTDIYPFYHPYLIKVVNVSTDFYLKYEKVKLDKIYLNIKNNLIYRLVKQYSPTTNLTNILDEISKSLALGETSSTAYAGDKGKANDDNIVSLQETKADITYVDTSLVALKDKLFDIIATTLEEDITTDSYVIPSAIDSHPIIKGIDCEVKSISGATRQFNQLLQKSNFRTLTYNGLTIKPLDNGKGLHIEGTAESSGNTWVINLGSSYTNYLNHKCLLKSNNTTNAQIRANDLQANTIGALTGQYFVLDMVAGRTYNEDIELQLYDLTSMYGVGNEPTSVEQFNKDYPLDYYDFDSGSIKNVSLSKIESYGCNVFNNDKELGWIEPSNGEDTKNNENTRQVGYTKVYPSKTYTFEVVDTTNRNRVVHEYDENKVHIKSTILYYPNMSITLSNTTEYVRLVYPSKDLTLNWNLHLGTEILGYKPYVGKLGTITLPNGKIDLYGINDIKDKLEFIEQENETYNAVLTRKVGKDDLGKSPWIYESGYFRVDRIGTSTNPLNKKNGAILCSKYPITNQYHSVMSDKMMTNRNYWTDNNIIVKDSSYDDVETFKTSMSGIPLYYELSKPTTEIIATGLTYEQVSMAFEKGGSIINDNSNTNYNVKATTTIDFVCKDWSI